MGRPLTAADDAAIRAGREAGLTVRQIGEITGRSHSAIKQRIHDLGLPHLTPELVLTRRRETLRKNVEQHPQPAAYSPEQDALLRKLWVQAVRIEEIADRLGRSRQAVCAHATRIGLGKRDRRMLASLNYSPRHSQKLKAVDTRRSARAGEHQWVIVGRIRTCARCGARQFASDTLVGVTRMRVWVCDAPATCRVAA